MNYVTVQREFNGVDSVITLAGSSGGTTLPSQSGNSGKVLSTDGSALSWVAANGTGDAHTSNPLSQFAATTSAQLRGVISDETGTGALVFAGGNIGAATATSVNGVTISGSSTPALTVTGTTSVSGTNTGDQDLSGYLLSSTAASSYQPLDADLTAIAALTTTSFGRSVLTQANAAALATLAGVGTGNSPAFAGVTINGTATFKNAAGDANVCVISESGITTTGVNITVGSGGSVTADSFIGALTGNASTATKLATARNINGVSFNGTADITVTVPVSTGVSGLGTSVATQLANAADGSNASGIGFRGVPVSGQASNYTLVMADAGKTIYHASGDGSGDTYTIPANASVAFPVGTAVTFVNLDSNSVSIAITSDTLYLAGTGSTGTRTLAQYGMATAVKVSSTLWLISGVGLT